MRTALLAASIALVAGTTVGCGGGEGGGAPTDASQADFCGTFEDFYADAAKLGEDSEDSEIVKALKDVGEKLEEIGTPEDISDEAREGFELTVQAIEDLDEDATQEDIEEIDKGFSDDEQKSVDAFDDYLSETCDDGGE